MTRLEEEVASSGRQQLGDCAGHVNPCLARRRDRLELAHRTTESLTRALGGRNSKDRA